MLFTRITTSPDKMGCVPCIRHLRFPVATAVAMVADGMTTDDILAEQPDLEAGDISVRSSSTRTNLPCSPDCSTTPDMTRSMFETSA